MGIWIIVALFVGVFVVERWIEARENEEPLDPWGEPFGNNYWFGAMTPDDRRRSKGGQNPPVPLTGPPPPPKGSGGRSDRVLPLADLVVSAYEDRDPAVKELAKAFRKTYGGQKNSAMHECLRHAKEIIEKNRRPTT